MLYTIITGASSGIGRAFAKEYAKRGDNLILIARSKDKLLGLKEILESTYTINVQIINYDLSQEKAGFTIYQIIKENGWTVDKCINSAGFATNGKVSETDWDKQHQQILVNVLALFDLTKLCLNDMLTRNEGTIINVASSSAYHPIPTMAVYAATKAFVLSFTEALAFECKQTNIKLLAISPGATDTNFSSEEAGVSFGKLRTPEHVVETSLRAIEQGKISKIDGLNNYITSTLLPRLFSRKMMVNFVGRIMNRLK